MTGGARWPIVLLAIAALAGVLVGWSAVFAAPDLALQLEAVGGGLTPRQAQLDLVAAQVRGAAEVLMLSADIEEVTFARYLLYPATVREVPVRPRPAVRAALDALPAGAFVLISRHGDRERLEDVDALSHGATPRLQEAARASDDVVLFRVLP